MTHRTSLAFASVLGIVCALSSVSIARADAQADLTAGRAASEAGDLDKALTLLTSAAQALPQSVEAQMALADCYLKLGQTDKALEKYRAVLKLSPDHAGAKRIVEGLTGSLKTAAERLALANSFLDLGAYTQAESAARQALELPGEAAQKAAARLTLARALLFSNSTTALDEAVRIIQSNENASDGRVLAALSLLVQAEPNISRIKELLQDVQPRPAKGPLNRLEASLEQLRELAVLLVQFEENNRLGEASSRLAEPLKSVPASPFRAAVLAHVIGKVAKAAQEESARGNISAALQIVWPMVGSGPVPGEDAVLKPVELKGGWIDASWDKGAPWVQAGRLLADIGRADWQKNGSRTALLGSWLAAETVRQATVAETRQIAGLELANGLAGLAAMSHPEPNRKPGEPRSRADEIEAVLLRESGVQLAAEGLQNQWIDLAAGLIARYEAIGDAETGLGLFAPLPFDARKIGLEWTGPGLKRWLQILGEKSAALGAKKFQEASATLAPDANKSLNKYDANALAIFGTLLALQPDTVAAAQTAQAIIDRYLAVEQYDAATEATQTLFAQQPGKAGDWALLRLKFRRLQIKEQKLLAGNLQLGKELDPLAKEALAAAFKELTNNPTKENRHAVIRLLDALVHHYAVLERRDLADAVIALAADAKLPKFDDWLLWTKANLQGRDAARAFAAAVGQATEPGKLAIVEQHKAELDLLIQLVSKYPDSDYFAPAVQRVSQLSELYQQQRAFDAAAGVLAIFLKAQPNLKIAPQLEYQSLMIQLAKANAAFNDRKDKVKPPEKLSADYQAVIDGIAAFLKAHPTGDQSPDALNQLLQIARTYGQAGAWPLAREVLARFAAAAPDFRSPGQLKLWQAATYLGELDLNYGLNLLSPLAPPQAGGLDGGGSLAFNGGFHYGKFGESLAMDADRLMPGDKASPAKTPAPVTAAPKPGGAGGSGIGIGAAGGGGVVGGGGAFGGGPQWAGGKSTFIGEAAGQQRASDDIGAAFEDAEGLDKPFDAKGDKSDISLAMIRQAEQRQLAQIATMRDQRDRFAQTPKASGQPDGQPNEPQASSGGAIALPNGPVLSEAEMKRQDEAADKAYALLIELVKTLPLAETPLAENARGQIVWMFSFFEGQLRYDRTVVLVKKFLTDRPADPQKVSLAFRALQDQLAWAGQRQRTDRVNNKWLDARNVLFAAARKDIAQFIKDFADKSDWVGQARLLTVDSYEREAALASAVSPVRSAGLLVNSVNALLVLYRTEPTHPAVSSFPQRMWNVADRLRALRQEDLGVYVLSQIPIYFPTNPLAQQAVLRIAELYATNLANPLKAVETYQEYLSVVGDSEPIRGQIFSIAQQLAAKQRYLEALHVYGVFVDSFPTDVRAPQALLAIGQIHQSNEVWKDALAAYQRILNEFPNAPITSQVKLAMAECDINLSEWNVARQLYNEFVQAYPQDGQVEMARQRMEILKNLNRYQTLLEDKEVQRNKDDAQFQIGMIVNERLGNHVKAVMEFRKVVKDFPNSSQAAAAQYEIGKALLAQNKLDDARLELLKVPKNYPNSPFANDALYYVGQSYENQAAKLAGVTVEKARAEAYELGQRQAYSQANDFNMRQSSGRGGLRAKLKEEGKSQALELEEASNAFLSVTNGQSLAVAGTIFAEQQAETMSALQVANRQDKINDAYRQAVATYNRVASEYPLGDMTDKSLLRMAQILETQLKDRDLAMQTYQKVVKFFPGTPVAEDAAWKVAKFYEAANKYKEAVDAYRDFIRNYPSSGRVPDAQYAVAEDLEQLGRWVEAMDAYETFRQKFTAHPKAQAAQDEINWIKAYRR